MWVCRPCNERHLDSQPACPSCGGLRSTVGVPGDDIDEQPSFVTRSLMELQAETAEQQRGADRERRLRRHAPWVQRIVRAEYVLQDILAAYRSSRARGALGLAWWVARGFLVLAVAGMVGWVVWPARVPYWGWLAAMGAAFLVADGAARHERRRQFTERKGAR